MTGKQIVNPLAGLIKAAAKKLPATTGETSIFDARLNNTSQDVFILADVSSSMGESAGSQCKIDILRDALAITAQSIPAARIWAFNSIAREVTVQTLPSPSGGTALHKALDAITELRPKKTVVITDGRPDDAAAALVAAKELTGVIDVIYCGPDSDAVALRFIRELAKIGLGEAVVRPLSIGPSAISYEIKRLALPAR